jgi:transposase
MAPTRKRYTPEFKLEALRLVETSGKPVPQVERELGLPSGILYRWRQRLADQGAEAFPGQGNLPASEERLRQLERENLVLRQERDILKKAIAVLSVRPE